MGAAERIRVRLSGAVQGVGMRPFVHRLANECGLSGFVHNGADGVTIEVEGAGIAGFLDRLSAEAPPLASIDAMGIDPLVPSGEPGFSIRQSTGGRAATRIVPDAATCPDCLDDLFNPLSRFVGYPFVNCTQCGPRFTITRGLPYDRVNTSMAGFAMCPDCATEYVDPANRRFHAEPIACPVCGPRLSVTPGVVAAGTKPHRRRDKRQRGKSLAEAWFSHRHGPACPGHLCQHVPRQVARTSRAMTHVENAVLRVAPRSGHPAP